MDLNEHATHLGGLLANLQSLEYALRVFLQGQVDARPLGIPHGTDIHTYPVGTELPESELTSYDSLDKLITKFNLKMKERGLPLIDATIVALRDALAHGRITSLVAPEQLRLIKFGRPKNSKVRVDFNEAMSDDWFSEQKKRTDEALQYVAKEAGMTVA